MTMGFQLCRRPYTSSTTITSLLDLCHNSPQRAPFCKVAEDVRNWQTHKTTLFGSPGPSSSCMLKTIYANNVGPRALASSIFSPKRTSGNQYYIYMIVCSIFRQRKKQGDYRGYVLCSIFRQRKKQWTTLVVHFVQEQRNKMQVKYVFESYVYRRGECTCMYIKKY